MQFTGYQHHQARQLAAAIEDEPDTECPECGGPAHYVADFDGEYLHALPVCDSSCRPCWLCVSTPTTEADDGPECVRCAAEAAAEDARLAMAVAS